jgi:hypothetical protein
MLFFRRFKKRIPIITEDDSRELKDLERKAYMDEARKLIERRGQEKAKRDLILREGDKWQAI